MGVEIRYIQRLPEHSPITTTQIYTHVAAAKQKEILSANVRLKKPVAKQAPDISILRDVSLEKLLNTAKRITAVKYTMIKHLVAERRTCRVLQINRNSYRYEPVTRADEDDILAAIIRLAANV